MKPYLYMGKFIFVLLSMAIGLTAEAAPRTTTLLNTFEIKLAKKQHFITSQADGYQTGILTSPIGKILVVAKDYIPQSFTSVKVRAFENGASAADVKILKRKNRALFYYETADQYHVYSTVGGQLVISKDSKAKFDFANLGLTGKSSRKVVGR